MHNKNYKREAVYQAMQACKQLGKAWGFGACVLGGKTGTDVKTAWEWANKMVKNNEAMIGRVFSNGPGEVRIVMVNTRQYVINQIKYHEDRIEDYKSRLQK